MLATQEATTLRSNSIFSRSLAGKRDRWHFLRLGAEWDRTALPIYETAARGKCVPLLKTLLTTRCTNDCTYCSFRTGRKCLRQSWEEEKLAGITMRLWREGRIMGLFLTSSVYRDPDYTTERQLDTLHRLRKLGFTGYIHLRIMPGVSRYYIREAVELADRVGVNLEAPTLEAFEDLCPSKGDYKGDVIKRLEWIVDEVQRARKKARNTCRAEFGFGKSGVDTQMIVGAVGETDWQHLKATMWLYQRLELRRAFYSGFDPIERTPLEDRPPCPSHREYRLYQSSFLIRDYGFSLRDFDGIVDDEGFLPNVDPKRAYAIKRKDLFPIDLNEAAYCDIVKIPRVGPVTAKKIIAAREKARIRYLANLERAIGRRLARAVAPYVDLKGKRLTQWLS